MQDWSQKSGNNYEFKRHHTPENGHPEHMNTARRQNRQPLLLAVTSSLKIFCTSKVEHLSYYNDSLRFARSGGSNPGRGDIFRTHPEQLCGAPSLQ